MLLITTEITLDELKKMALKMHNNLVKAVVDIEKGIMIVDAELHADQEDTFLENGSAQQNLWGINLHPSKFGSDDFIEFDSMINIRPSQGNYDRGVNDTATQKKIVSIVNQLVIS
ncbi:MAG TPA: DUF5674 family protein [Candidatus Babeliales bacterium]|nr:DUF5674 family protein [Candidatus Babeliales bacterium]